MLRSLSELHLQLLGHLCSCGRVEIEVQERGTSSHEFFCPASRCMWCVQYGKTAPKNIRPDRQLSTSGDQNLGMILCFSCMRLSPGYEPARVAGSVCEHSLWCSCFKTSGLVRMEQEAGFRRSPLRDCLSIVDRLARALVYCASRASAHVSRLENGLTG